MASIRKNGNDSYLILVSCGRDENHKQIFKRCTYHPQSTAPSKIKKEVQAFAVDFEKRVREGKYYSGEKMTVAQFIEEWDKNWAADHLTQKVREGYKDKLRLYIIPAIGRIQLSKVTPLQCQNILNEQREGRKPATVRMTFTAMDSVFKFAYKMGVIEENPCSRCELPRIEHDTELHYFTLDQAKRFLAALDDTYPKTFPAHKTARYHHDGIVDVQEYTQELPIPTQFKAYFYLALYGGFRRGEMLALTWKDIDFENRTISINKAVVTTHEGVLQKGPKTKAGIRTITMPSVCFKVLKEWRREELALRLSLGTAWEGKDDFSETYIFIRNNGALMGLQTPSRRFTQIVRLYNEKIRREAEEIEDPREKKKKLELILPEIRLHDLRHTSATLLLAEGTDIETVSHRLGHSKPSITLDVYGHALPNKDVEASDTLEKMFGGL